MSRSLEVYYLHGFMGDPSDWDEVMKIVPGTALKYPFELPEKGILIGYSMGGRIALTSPLPKIVISASPGLGDGKESYWIEKLKNCSLHDFLTEWYDQPLFASLKRRPTFQNIFTTRLKQNPQVLIQQLEKHPKQQTQLRNVIFMHGEHDEKYKNLYKELNIPSLEIPNAGHACHLENPEEVACQIKTLIASL